MLHDKRQGAQSRGSQEQGPHENAKARNTGTNNVGLLLYFSFSVVTLNRASKLAPCENQKPSTTTAAFQHTQRHTTPAQATHNERSTTALEQLADVRSRRELPHQGENHPHLQTHRHTHTLLSVRSGCYNRQGRKAKNRRSRDSYSNRAYTRTQTVHNTGTHNLCPLAISCAALRFRCLLESTL